MKHPILRLATAALLAGAALQLQADEVTLTTALPAGEHLSLAMNADVSATLTWGDGTTQTVESTGQPIEVEVKSPQLTIASADAITCLYVQGNQLTALNVRKAPALKVLLCADNQLTQLDLSQNASLTTLDAQGNQLTQLSATAAKGITTLNVAQNALTRLSLATAARPAVLVANDNQLTALPSTSVMAQAQTIWAPSNKIGTLPIGFATGLRSVVMSANALKEANFPFTPLLREVWLDGNQLTELDLSRQSPKLQALVANDNKLGLVKWDKTSKSTAKYVYLQRNALFPNSMPSLIYGGQAIDANIGEQRPYQLDNRVVEIGGSVNLSSLVKTNGWGISVNPTVSIVDSEGQTLTPGTDYKLSNSNLTFTFPELRKGLHFEVTSRSYADHTWQSVTFNVGTTEAIGSVEAAQALQLTPARGRLTVHAAQPVRLRVVSAAGILMADEQLEANASRTLALPTGVYVVNGQKVAVK